MSLPTCDGEQLGKDIEEALRMMPHDNTFDNKPSNPAGRPRLKELFENVQESMMEIMKTMKKELKDDHIDDFIRLHNIWLSLQHWRNDIRPKIANQESDKGSQAEGYDALLVVEDRGSVFATLAETVRDSFMAIISSQRQLQVNFNGPRQDNDHIHIIKDLEGQVKGLRGFINPLRTLYEVDRNVGKVARIAEEVALIKESLGEPFPTEDDAEILRPGATAPVPPATKVSSATTSPTMRRKRGIGAAEERMTLSRKMTECFDESCFDGNPRDFLPAGFVEQFINKESREAVMQELKLDDPEEDRDLVDYILDRASRLFAIVVNIPFEGESLWTAIMSFKEKGVDDSSLPLIPQRSRGPGDPARRGTIRPEDVDKTFWNQGRCKGFYRSQWEILVPTFSTDKSNQDLNRRAILPFTEKGRDSKRGGFGEVFKVKIHKRHLSDPGNTFDKLPEYVAVKHIRPNTVMTQDIINRFWEKEARNLLGMMKRKVEHTVRFITAFRREDGEKDGEFNHYLICEWADGGSLREVWDHIKQPVLNANLVQEATVQLLGLAGALVAAHYPSPGHDHPFIRHGDLKPENILCFKGDGILGTLKIGDWGLAKQKNYATVEQMLRSSLPGGTVRYEPPESWTGILINGKMDDKKRSRLQDTWAMGCIILEFIIWMLYGIERVNAFQKELNGRQHDSAYWDEARSNKLSAGKKEADVAALVKEEMNKIARDPRCGSKTDETALSSLLELVRSRLLIVPLPPGLGHVDMGGERSGRARPSRQRKIAAGDETDTEVLEDIQDEATPTIVVVSHDDEQQEDSGKEELNRPDEKKVYRARATELHKVLQEIKGRGDVERSYWYMDRVNPLHPTATKPPPSAAVATGDAPVDSWPSTTTAIDSDASYSTPATIADTLSSVSSSGSRPTGLRPPRDQKNLQDYKHPILDNDWIFHTDNVFASILFRAIRTKRLSGYPEAIPSATLCKDCERLEFGKIGFSVQYDTGELQRKAALCDLCKLFWDTCVRCEATSLATASFVREESWLKLNGAGPPVLSICRHPDSNSSPIDFQIGLPACPKPGSEAHFEILRQWLEACEGGHMHPPIDQTLPTRLVDVGQGGSHFVRLCETSDDDFVPGQYVALSHPWGRPPHFCTLRSNLEEHKRSIQLDLLPATFRDAVLVTRALQLRYVWIDSICIIQGPDGDFGNEAKRMEQVFSAAHCVIAASSSFGQFDSFLSKARAEQRRYVPLHRLGQRPSVYICEAIDDFSSDALESPLSRRGWALQERALARRSIFFTDTQTYWECGNGVRCTTMAKMTNSLAALLGDTYFPQIMMSATKGERILRYQDFYKNYSRLSMTRDSDRPIAIDGLQSRLLKAFNTEGDFGIFDEGPLLGHLRRSLLWHRAADVPTLKPIVFPPDRHCKDTPPSWSHVAYVGGINYFELEFNGIDWESLESPWGRPGWPPVAQQLPNGRMTLGGLAREFSQPAIGRGGDCIIFDMPEQEVSGLVQKCVVLGQTNSTTPVHGVRMSYVLVITPDDNLGQHSQLWRRVGAGYLPQSYVSTSWEHVLIH